MHKGIALLPTLVLLTACQAPAEHTAALCRAQGYSEGTLDFEACRQSIDHDVLVAHADQAQAENAARTPSMITMRH
ncbi:MAG TPA: hypothetical protein VL899_02705 [Alphaproteobacteria bacterium]|jgi:hypothetical protein|nr:hypothetical protein [Alphaproteobacteria bacterium]